MSTDLTTHGTGEHGSGRPAHGGATAARATRATAARSRRARASPRSRSACSATGTTTAPSSPPSRRARPATDGANEFVFYDGPPFANGLPHYGHLLTGYVKDVVPRFRTMQGRRVERRFGWDCHGLPAEVEAEKQLGHQPQVRDPRHGPRAVQRRLPHVGAAGTPTSGSPTSPGRRGGSTSTTTTRPSTWTTWSRSCGRSRRSTTRAWSTRASACSPTAGAARPRCPTPRPGWTTSTAPGRTRPSRSACAWRPASSR